MCVIIKNKKQPAGVWKPVYDGVEASANAKRNKHDAAYANLGYTFVPLAADTYGDLSEDFVRFIWLVATIAVTNSRQSQPQVEDDESQKVDDDFQRVRGLLFTRMKSRIGIALAKAATA